MIRSMRCGTELPLIMEKAWLKLLMPDVRMRAESAFMESFSINKFTFWGRSFPKKKADAFHLLLFLWVSRTSAV